MRLSPELAARARALAAGEIEPVPTRPAATVALLRDSAAGPEVYLLRRVRGMSFAPGMHVFPGGSLEPGDGTGEEALVFTAIRETFEEAGVLLAGPTPQSVVGDVSSPEWEAARAQLESGAVSLPALLAGRGLVPRTDLLTRLAHWITPVVELKRFDTHFFLAALPPGQTPQAVGTEADQRRWIRPAAALEQELTMLPPTRAVLRDLARFGTVAEALAAERDIVTVRPRVEIEGDGARLVV
jgi:8-oxo-dGTP pyrophosphatase MutT (NUDIX family)